MREKPSIRSGELNFILTNSLPRVSFENNADQELGVEIVYYKGTEKGSVAGINSPV
jgi:hypothetical protein